MNLHLAMLDNQWKQVLKGRDAERFVLVALRWGAVLQAKAYFAPTE